MKNSRPNVIRISDQGVYRLDLRRKAFNDIRQTVSNGKQCLEFRTRAAAERKADEIQNLLEQYGTRKIRTLEQVMRIDPLDLQARLAPYGKTIQDAVEFYVNHLKELAQVQSSQTLGVLMEDWLAEKELRVDQRTLRKATYETLYYKVKGEDGYIAEWGDRPVASITVKEIREWIEYRMVRTTTGVSVASQTSKLHQLSYLSQFFIWCKKTHGIPKENPCQSITFQRNEESGEVEFFTPEEAKKIMEHSMTKRFVSLLPYNAICLFSGVRAAECERLTWDNIDFEDKTIVLINADTKTSHGRRVAMQPNLVAWLNWFREKYPQYPLVPEIGMDDKKRQFRKTVGVSQWHKNGLKAQCSLLYSRCENW
jgi:integrase